MNNTDSPKANGISRRQALEMLGGSVAALLLTSCGGGSSSTDSTSSGTSSSSSSSSTSSSISSTSTSTTTSSSCAVTPEGEIGPYFADDSASGFNRSTILSNISGTETQTGVPFTLVIYVVDTEKNCAAVSGAQVDIWHCNASGVYSDIAAENTSSENWLRGYQITDSAGMVTFNTIIPGWYSGRTTHIHLRVRSSYNEASSTSDGSNTTQVFFPQSLINTLSTSVSPYKAEGTNPTTNASDRVYTTQTMGEAELTLSGDTTNGYVATYTIGLPITTT